jgi:hypothetical protein
LAKAIIDLGFYLLEYKPFGRPNNSERTVLCLKAYLSSNIEAVGASRPCPSLDILMRFDYRLPRLIPYVT